MSGIAFRCRRGEEGNHFDYSYKIYFKVNGKSIVIILHRGRLTELVGCLDRVI